jgi:hypothetical protein
MLGPLKQRQKYMDNDQIKLVLMAGMAVPILTFPDNKHGLIVDMENLEKIIIFSARHLFNMDDKRIIEVYRFVESAVQELNARCYGDMHPFHPDDLK